MQTSLSKKSRVEPFARLAQKVSVFVLMVTALGHFCVETQLLASQGNTPSSSGTTLASSAPKASDHFMLEEIQRANDAYRNSQFEEAFKIYQNLIDSGEVSPGLYYNFGNAAYRMNDASLALAAFRLAQEQTPRDSEVQANIDFIKRFSPQQSAEGPQGWFDYLPWNGLASASEYLYLSSFFAGAFFLCLAIGRFYSNRSLAIFSWVLAILTLVCGLGLIARNSKTQKGSRGLVTAEKVAVRSEASEQSLELFQLSKTAEFRVLDRFVTGVSAHSDSSNTASKDASDAPALSRVARQTQDGVWYRIRFDAHTMGFVPAESVLVY